MNDPAGQREVTVTSADGTRIVSTITGTGPSLVLVHGAAVSGDCWRLTARALASHFTTYAIDRRGRGRSGDSADYAVEREIEDLKALIAAIPAPVHVLGHSSGGLLALEVARVTPEVRRLVVYEPPVLEPSVLVGESEAARALPGRLRALVAAGRPEAAARLFFREGPRLEPAELERIERSPLWPGTLAVAATLAYDVEIFLGFELAPAVPAAGSAPTLVLCGGASPSWVRAGLEQLVGTLPASRLEVLPGQKHGALWAAPTLLAEAAMAFLFAKT